jgi:hypothetical protein
MQAKRANEKEKEKILEWICPKVDNYLTPKRSDEVKDTCQQFLDSNEYLGWAGREPSTFICKGQRPFLP